MRLGKKLGGVGQGLLLATRQLMKDRRVDFRNRLRFDFASNEHDFLLIVHLLALISVVVIDHEMVLANRLVR